MGRFGMVLRRTGIACVLGVWFSSTVAADPILLSMNRRVVGETEASSEFGFDSTNVSDSRSGTGLFDVRFTGAALAQPASADFRVSQKTDISSTGWSGSGTAQASASVQGEGFASASAESLMEVALRLTEPMFYRFSGTVTANLMPSFISFGGEGFSWFIEGDEVPRVVTRSGLLAAGDYTFLAVASGSVAVGGDDGGGSGGAFDLQFTLSDSAPVPEPATLLLFGTGAAAIGRRVWRRRKGTAAICASEPARACVPGGSPGASASH